MPRCFIILTLAAFTCGCASFHVYPREDRDVIAPTHRTAAVVTNPELSHEAAILNHASIYELDHPGEHPVRITLEPLEVRKAGGKIFVFAIFLGLLPVQHADVYEMSFTVEDADGVVRRRSHELRVAERWWLFNVLSGSRDRDRKLGEALRARILAP